MSNWPYSATPGRRVSSCLSLLVLLGVLLSSCGGPAVRSGPTIVIAADARIEQQLLAQLTAQFLRDRGYPVEIQTSLHAEWMTRRALESGRVGLVWQETGRVWHAYLGHDMPITNEAELFRRVRDEDRLNGIIWLSPCSWSARMGVIVTNEMAAAQRLASIDDLAQHVRRGEPSLVLCVPEELYTSSWGVRGLERIHGFQFDPTQVRHMSLEEAYAELLTGGCDVALGYRKDISAYGGTLVTLRDAQTFFSASSLAPTIHVSIQSAYPELERTLAELTAALDATSLVAMEQQAGTGRARPERIAQQFLRQAGLVTQR